MPDLAQVTSAAGIVGTVRIAGVSYPVRVLPMLALGRLQKIINTLPNPRPFAATKARLDAHLAEGVIAKDEHTFEVGRARAEAATWPPDAITDPRGMAITQNDPECQKVVLEEALRLTPEAAETLIPSVSLATYLKLWGMTFAEEDDPKDGAVPKDVQPPTDRDESSAT